MEDASQLHSTLHYLRLVFVSDADMRKDGNYTCELLLACPGELVTLTGILTALRTH